jgi:predicted PurR-regulated permease PerM
VGGRAQVHPLVVCLSVLGALVVFGALGVLAGPVLFVLALLALEMGRLAAEPAARRPPVVVAREEAGPPPV